MKPAVSLKIRGEKRRAVENNRPPLFVLLVLQPDGGRRV
jgi:hypothetical protein